MSPSRVRMPEIYRNDSDSWLTVCPACRKRWESARHESRDWVEFVAAHHRDLHREKKI